MGKSTSNAQIDDRFQVRGRMEILDVLNDLIHRREPVSLQFGDAQESFVTTLLEARHKALTFEAADDAEVNRRLQACRACVFVAYPDGILVKFSSDHARHLLWGGADAYCVRLPTSVVRLQRQQSVRVLIPSAAAPVVGLYAADGAGVAEWRMRDLSIGGFGASLPDRPQLEPIQSIAKARFELPDYGHIDCCARVRHVSHVPSAGSARSYQVGVGFSSLSPEIEAAIQRYVIKIEHQRRSAKKFGEW